MQKQRLAIGAAVAAGLITLGSIAGGVVSVGAQTPSATPTASARPTADERLAKLAANLGISVDQLKAGMKKAELQRIDESLAAGRLTADQAAAKARVEAGQSGPGLGGPGAAGGDHGKRGGPGGGQRGPGEEHGLGAHGGMGRDGGPMAAAATAIGIDAKTLMSEMRAGKSLAQVAQAPGKSRDQLKAALSQQFGASLDAMIDRVPPVRPAGVPGGAPGTPPKA